MAKKTKTEMIVELITKKGVAKLEELVKRGIHPEYVRRLCIKGVLTQTGRGLYTLTNSDITENLGIANVCKWVPKGVICLFSALQFHNIGTQSPFEVWMALDRETARPRIKFPPLRIMRYSGKAFSEGIKIHRIKGVDCKIYCVAKTVADCFKYRNKIGLDVAIEALRESLKEKKCTMNELWEFSKICRVEKIMRPYMEAIT